MKVLVFFLSYLALVWGQTTIVSPCVSHGTAANLPINTYVVGCDGPSCSFPQLETVELQIIMQSPRQMRSMTTRAYAYVFGPIGLPYDLGDEADTCNFFTNTYCPLQKDEVAQYTLRMRIEPFMPVGTRATIEFVISDDADDSTITCLRIPITITRPLFKALDAENKTDETA